MNRRRRPEPGPPARAGEGSLVSGLATTVAAARARVAATARGHAGAPGAGAGSRGSVATATASRPRSTTRSRSTGDGHRRATGSRSRASGGASSSRRTVRIDSSPVSGHRPWGSRSAGSRSAKHSTAPSTGRSRNRPATRPAARSRSLTATAQGAAAGAVHLGHQLVNQALDRTRPPTRARPGGEELSPERVRRRIIGVGLVLAVLFTTVVVRLVSLQVLNPAPFEALSQAQRLRSEPLAADRGSILDRNGVELALSMPQTSIFVDPKLVTDPTTEAVRLAEAVGGDRAEIEAKMRAPNRFGYVARHVSAEVADRVKALDLAGVAFVDEPRRFMPSGDLAAGIVGTTDVDGRGLSGLERQYADQLTGQPGRVVIEQTPEGRTIPIGENQVIPAVKGQDLVLTIDRNLQFDVERILADQVAASGAKGAVAVVSKPRTGEILAMANVRSDPKTNEVHPSTDNAALTGVYEPGSVMKLVTAAGAIEEGKVTPDTVIPLPISLTLGGAEFTDAEARGAVAWPVSQIISESSNIGTIILGQKLGREKVVQFMHDFGFGSRTGLDFPNEQAGVVPAAKDWWDSSAGSVPIGQGVSVTPLQMLQAYNVVANRGRYVAPKLVNAVVDGGERRPTETSPGRPVISEATADKMNLILRDVVASGTGKKAAVPGYTVAGKTGTARKPQPTGGYTDAAGAVHYEATFVGFAPAENPEVSVIVIIDDPAGGQIYGGTVAAPAFSKITEASLRQLSVPPPAIDVTGGGQAADPGRQATEAGATADETPAFETTPDGRKRALPATDARPDPSGSTNGSAAAAGTGTVAGPSATYGGARPATAPGAARAPTTTATTRTTAGSTPTYGGAGRR